MKKNLLPYISSPWRILASVLPLLIVLLPLSCSQDDETVMGKATVKMIFTTRANAQTGDASTLDERERMKTLRVIMENANTKKILYNVYYDDLQGATSKTIILSDVPVEGEGTPFNFYAIANEQSFLGQDESLEGKGVDLAALYDRELDIDFNSNITLSIPQAKKNQKIIQPVKGTQEHTIPLEFPVAKVCVNFTNEIEAPQTITDIQLPGLKMKGGKLFPQDFGVEAEPKPSAGNGAIEGFQPQSLTVTAGTYGGSLGKGSVKPLYVYPATSGVTPEPNYQLTANWAEATQPNQTVDLNANGKLAEGIRRGMQLNIGIALKYGRMELNNLSVKVDDWTNADPIAPDFQ